VTSRPDLENSFARSRAIGSAEEEEEEEEEEVEDEERPGAM
jgi:hypothetical protein